MLLTIEDQDKKTLPKSPLSRYDVLLLLNPHIPPACPPPSPGRRPPSPAASQRGATQESSTFQACSLGQFHLKRKGSYSRQTDQATRSLRIAKKTGSKTLQDRTPVRVERPLNPLSHGTSDRLGLGGSRQTGTHQDGLNKNDIGLDALPDEKKDHG